VALFFGVAAVLAMMGGLFQVNPVWLYGPFRPEQVSSPAQPDWDLGWLEGALRLFPPIEFRGLGFEIPNPFYPGALLPGLTFGLLYIWPFLEQRFTGDREPHHLLQRPRDAPIRTALGVATLALYVVLFAAASNDLLAKALKVSVKSVTITYQVLTLVLPPIAGYVTYRLMAALRRHGDESVMELPLRAITARRGARDAGS
jgi:ubiquinol-cytochrome c reductase cytochrome b subunit